MIDPAAETIDSGSATLFDTPVGVVDVERVRANAERAARYCAEHGIDWRPHVKTHKCLQVACIQLEAGANGLTVATPREAEVMSTVADDLLLAYPPIGPAKVSRLIGLPESLRLTVGLDSETALRPLAAAAAAAGRTIGVLIEIDAGLERVGVTTPTEAVVLAEMAGTLPGLEYRGVMFYPGHLRVPAAEQEQGLATLNERLAGFLEALSGRGLTPGIVSGGSTPTLWQSHRIDALTEVRPGTCIYNDRDILLMGACEPETLAYTVLATVVSTAVPGQAVVDAGSKALSKEAIRSGVGGYGQLLDRPEVSLRALSEEHGILDLSDTDWRPDVGDTVRIVPNHVCLSVNLQDYVVAVERDDARPWALDGRGRGPYDSHS